MATRKAKLLTAPAEAVPVPTTCMTEGCSGMAKWKGVCPECYGQAKALIEAGQTTWEELNDLKLVFIPDKPFTAAFKKAKGLL